MREKFFGERKALVGLIVQSLRLDVRHMHAFARMPLDTLRDLKQNLGLAYASEAGALESIRSCQDAVAQLGAKQNARVLKKVFKE